MRILSSASYFISNESSNMLQFAPPLEYIYALEKSLHSLDQILTDDLVDEFVDEPISISEYPNAFVESICFFCRIPFDISTVFFIKCKGKLTGHDKTFNITFRDHREQIKYFNDLSLSRLKSNIRDLKIEKMIHQ